MSNYPRAEDLKSAIPDFKNVDIKVENQRIEGENLTLYDGQLIKGGTDFAKALKEAMPENKHVTYITDGDPEDVTGTPEEIKSYNEHQKIKAEELLKLIKNSNTQNLEVSGSYLTQEKKDKILEVIGKWRDDNAKNNDVKPK